MKTEITRMVPEEEDKRDGEVLKGGLPDEKTRET
jgi:hypothetical protein